MNDHQKNALNKAEAIVARAVEANQDSLELKIRGLIELPRNLQQLKALTRLTIGGERLSKLPEWFLEFEQLKVLQIMGAGIEHLPTWFGKMKGLECVNLTNPQHVKNLEVIGELTQLKSLFLQNGTLPTLPEFVRTLTHLELLVICSLELTKLPDWISDLTRLRHLSADRNRLTDLPNSFARLGALRILDLEQNFFSDFPSILSKLPTLEELNLAENVGLQIPAEILGGKSAREILKYVARLEDHGKRQPLNEAKMILVGRGAVGKTTLVHQLVHGSFVPKTKTKGIKVSDWTVRGPEGEITTHIWDFGGQEIMHGTHQFFLTERSLYLLVLAGREDREDEDAEYWLKMIRAFGGDSPVIVVLNKIKEHHFDLNEQALLEKFPNIVAFIETDCKPGRGKTTEGYHIARLRKLIETQIAGMDSVKASFPAAWRAIKDRLTNMKENFMPFDQFRLLCGELGEKKSKDQEELAHFLHLLGIALNYRDDPRLRETSVLNPKWVTTGIYKLLNDAAIKKRRGVIKLSDLSRVLPAKGYPKEMHSFLLNLMKKFELCFPLDDEGREHLIPELLGKKQPNLADEFAIEKCLCFEFHYGSLLPEGLLPRFIVRAYTRIEDDLRWRSGVVLGWKGARALIRADEGERQVLIRVSDSSIAAKELLALVLDHFDQIHGNFKKLEPQEKVRVPRQPDLLVDFREAEFAARRHNGEVTVFFRGDLHTILAAPLISRFRLTGAPSRHGSRSITRN